MNFRRMEVAGMAAVVLMLISTVSVATPIPVTLVAEDFNNLLGGSASPIGSPLITHMSLGNLQTDVISQAFTDNAGNYAYLYQINNFGTTGNSVAEVFTCSPFFGASGSTVVGYLTANAPTGFVIGDQTPFAISIDAEAGPTVSFAFPAFIAGHAIDPGEYSSTLYILSDDAPGLVMGNVIDGVVASGNVVGPVVPEPATLTMLAFGGLTLIRRKRK